MSLDSKSIFHIGNYSAYFKQRETLLLLICSKVYIIVNSYARLSSCYRSQLNEYRLIEEESWKLTG